MVDQDTFEKYLIERYQNQVTWYDKKSIHNQKWAKRYRVAIIVIAAITPVLAALELKWLTIISSALVAVMVGVLQYCKFDEHWHNYRMTCETLKKEKVLFDYRISPYDKAEEPKGLFIERVESLISKEHTRWIQLVTKKNDKENKG